MSRRLGIVYGQVKLSPGRSFNVGRMWHPKIDAWSPVYSDMMKPFDLHKFTVPRLPINMGPLAIEKVRACPNVLRVPIKWGGSTEVRVPRELLPLEEELMRLLQYDYFVTGPRWRKFFCHLTVHNEWVDPGKTQRFPGFHGDGLQGGKFKRKLVCEHSYVATDPQPTIVAMQPFFVSHLNEDRDNVFLAFDQQVRRDSLYRLLGGHLYLIDPYVVHESPIISQRVFRTFFRLTTTPTELLMPKNTVNPMFGGQEYPARIEVREFTSRPDPVIPYRLYGLDASGPSM